MSYQVKLTVYANEVAKSLPPETKKVAKESIRKIAENPDIGKALQVELAGFRSFRFMRYRIVYRVNIEEKLVVIWAIGNRRDIYENFSEYLIQKT